MTWITALLLTACESGAGAPEAQTEEPSTDICEGCPAECRPFERLCDIRDLPCRERVFEAIRCVRGGTAEMPVTRVVSQAELAEILAIDEPEDPEARQTRRDWEWLLKRLGLLSEGASYNEAFVDTGVENVMGLYERQSKEVLVVDQGRPFDSSWPLMALIHEFVHALQDREQPLGHLYAAAVTQDAYFATSAVIEGEADFYEWLVGGFIHDMTLEELAPRTIFEGELRYYQREALFSPSPWVVGMGSLRYPLGGLHVLDRWLADGDEGVRRFRLEAPRVSVGWMDAAEPWRTPLECPPPRPEGFTRLGEDRFGAVALFLFLGAIPRSNPLLPIAPSWELALEWQDDYVALYRRDTVPAASWSLRMKSAEAAAAVADLARSTQVSVILDGPEVHLLMGDETVDEWSGDGGWECLPR